MIKFHYFFPVLISLILILHSPIILWVELLPHAQHSTFIGRCSSPLQSFCTLILKGNQLGFKVLFTFYVSCTFIQFPSSLDLKNLKKGEEVENQPARLWSFFAFQFKFRTSRHTFTRSHLKMILPEFLR